MKTKTLFYMALMAVMTTLAACSQDDDMQQDTAPKATPIEFEITDGGYGGDEATRAKEEGYYTRFEATDECGLYIVNGSTLEAENVKLTASEVNGELTWKTETPISINHNVGYSCFLYYPYQDEMTDKIDVNKTGEDTDFFENLISGWEVQPDQSNHDNYTKSDLMTAKGTATYDGSTLKLSFKLAHRMALAEIVAPVKVDFPVGGNLYTPYQADEWKYRFIVNPKTVDENRKVWGNINVKTFTINSTKLKALTPGQYKTFKVGSSYYVELGEGTTIYHVYDYNGLMAWAAVGGNYSCKLEADITMPELKDGETYNWTPVSYLSGIFDGNGHTITGLVVNNQTTEYAGFIANNLGTVKNLTLKDAKITGITYVGGVVSYNDRGTIENCHVTGESAIKGSSNAGGVVGVNSGGTIKNCHVAEDCSVYGDDAGGIAGNNENGGTVTGCYALCSLTGKRDCTFGGIIGRFSDSGSLTACYSKCSYSNYAFIGGILGKVVSGTPTFTACYYDKCDKGVDNATDPTIKVDGTDGKTWADAMKGMNEALTAAGYTDYEYAVNGDSETEPLILVKKQ